MAFPPVVQMVLKVFCDIFVEDGEKMKMNLASTLGEFNPSPVMLNAKDLFAHGIQEILGPFNEELLYHKGVIIDGFIPIGFVVGEIDLASISVAPPPIDRILPLGNPYAFLEE